MMLQPLVQDLPSYIRDSTHLIEKLKDVRLPEQTWLLSGTAMGARCAPSFANLFMGWWEETSVYPSRAYRENVLYWFRFIDDILFIWAGSREGCEEFLRILNDNIHNIHLTFEISLSTVEFLDLRLIRQNDTIYTDLFRKSTAANGLLDYKSFHPHHLKKNLPTGQFYRIRRNCTLQSDFCSQAKALSTRLQARGYPRSIIKNALQRTKSIPRAQLLQPRNKQADNNLRYITTFHNHWKEVSELFGRHWNILKTDPKVHSINTRDLRVTGLQRIPPNIRKMDRQGELLRLEARWIYQLGSPSLQSLTMCPNSGLPPHVKYRCTQEKLPNKF
ncbi:unnamed protein product [Ranitomeya imitator]|uniref:Helix-turn-helix domain-containing protein n=1 Tax=Ranitomeya imitator TaxID=111125 RepID=A0ABN9M9E0_9NEOB|nr:unnamed protein product [Ranitomeya imitator]